MAGILSNMFSGWNWAVHCLYLFLNICSFEVSGGLVQSCGHIIPESPVLALGSNFTALCILNESCLDFGNIYASQIIWKIKNKVVPKEQYREINRTVSSVTFNDTSSLATPLTCNVLADGQIEQNIYGISVTVGLPPEKPENLSCIVYQVSKLTYPMECTWDPGRHTFLDTNFRLKYRWSRESFPDCIPKYVNNSCTISDVQFFVNLEVWVEAANALGKAESDRLVFDPIEIVKPLPPHNLSVNSGILPTVLKLSWENRISAAVMKLKFNIRYRISSDTNWMQVPPEDTASPRTSFSVQGLRPYTEYVFSIRCMKEDGVGFWSDWSEEKVGVTTEDKPSKGPTIWRTIDASPSPAFWTVRLMWKALEPFEANGVISQYEVTVRAKPPLSHPPQKYNVTTTSLTLKLPNGTYEVTLIAHNRVGASPPSVLLIPASNSKAPVKNIRTLPKDGKLWVGWIAPNNVLKYVIEWCLMSSSSDCITEWQIEPGNIQGTYLKGDIKPFKCYLITVYPLYADGQGSGQSVKAYLQQDRPSKGPTVQTKKVGKAEAVLTWNRLTVDEQNGFIRSYTILYKTVDGNETAVSVDPSKTEYTLSSLTSDTLYTVRMMAYTDEGGRSGPDFTFTTQKFGRGEIEAIVVPVCLAFLLTVLLGVLFCFNKRDLIKKHIWPNVPDPSKSNIAQWSPQVPAKHAFSSKDQMYPEGSFTDVSVVEIEADDKKSFSEQDLKPFDLLKKEKSTSEGHSSGIGGSSCMSSPRQSVSDSDEGETTQNTSSTVQYSTVVLNGYRDQTPVQVFSRSESTQPLLDSEERLEDHAGGSDSTQRQHYFKQNCGQDEIKTDRPFFERAKQIIPANEEDLAGFAQLQVSGQSSQSLGFELEENTQEATVPDVLQTSTEGQTVRPETVEENLPSVDEMPKSYLPQTVRQGGYMPQ
ncbi:interleukin-6 receptor subunit beta isoform X1 [Numida meleagris]|uniref:interleukin-6 receptor subunit beta isoform X1 n=2 Tax=Numida meleagris TaxID=8996 RepID=UPI000B3E33AC|nr:interleukin-6 receptor subunit beta isoform X1 [Numida meleagris]